MPVHYQPIGTFHSHSAGASPGLIDAGPSVELPVSLPLPLAADPLDPTILVARLDALGPRPRLATVRVVFNVPGPGAPTDPAFGEARAGETHWIMTAVNGATIRVANGVRSPIVDVVNTSAMPGPVIVQEPVAAITIGGAALALFSAPPTDVLISADFTVRNQFCPSPAQHGGFFDPAGDPRAAGLLGSTLAMLANNPGGAFQIQAGAILPARINGVPNDLGFALDCLFAAPSAWGAIWCDASDVGVSAPEKTRIPGAVAENSSLAYNRYPSSFYRRSNFARGVVRAADARGMPITMPLGALTLYTTAVDLSASEWLFQIDGVSFAAIISHGGLAGLRRPADVWNRVIYTAIDRNLPLELLETPAAPLPGPDPFVLRGLLGRLEYLEHAEFIAGYTVQQGDLVNPYTPRGQTGGTPPPPPGPP